MQAHIVIDSKVETTRSIETTLAAYHDRRIMWIELEERTPETDKLLETFNIHPMAAEDIWVDRMVPKLEEFEHYLHILVHGASPGKRSTSVVTWSLNIVLGTTCVMTHQGNATFKPRPERCFARLLDGPARLAHHLIDQVVDGHVALIEDLGGRVDALDREVMQPEDQRDSRSMALQLFDLRRSIQTLARLARRQLETLGSLYKAKHPVIPADLLPYFRDIYDHFLAVSDLIDRYHEEIGNSLDSLVSVQSARINSVIKTLTILSTVILPLTLIAGIFGMNYRLPGADSPYGFLGALGVMAAAGMGFLLWFKYRHLV